MILVLFVALIVALFIGIPVGFAIGISSMIFLLISGFPPLSIIPQRMVEGVNSFPLMALPLFILSGEIMAYGATPRLMRLANMILGRVPGGLGAAAAGGCAFFGAISGSGVATTAAIGSIMGPEMVKNGYHKSFTASLLAGAGALGIIIPPSISMVVYGTACTVSIGDLFLAGIIPGLLTVGFLIGLDVVLGIKRSYRNAVGNNLSLGEHFVVFVDALLPLFMPIIILGGVLSGIFTPTEAAAIAVFYAFFLAAFIYRELKLSDIYTICARSAETSAIILFIMATAAPFGWIMATQNVPEVFAKVLLSLSSNPVVIYLLIMVLLLFLGTFMETNSTIILVAPILLPVVTTLGFSPIHFGIAMILNLAIGGATPPLAVCLFTSCKILGISVEDTFPDIVYVVLTMCVALLIVVLFPQLSLFLVDILGR
ncbi:MAG: C4-dicarboxylate transporter, DctM subunit [Synergistaceae bacterium]|nr:C4-dicarboxylate transporter, DctM subunit [Synergistaceae bacterium]